MWNNGYANHGNQGVYDDRDTLTSHMQRRAIENDKNRQERKKRAQELDARRNRALERISIAAREHLPDYGNNLEQQQTLQSRLDLAASARIEICERIADRAEKGDFTSDPKQAVSEPKKRKEKKSKDTVMALAFTEMRKKQKNEDIERRRDSISKRILDAAKDKFGEGYDSIAILDRAKKARESRLSYGEAIADLAERGDFESELEWIEVFDNPVAIWKGYVIDGTNKSVTFHLLGRLIRANVWRISPEGYICLMESSSRKGKKGDIVVGHSLENGYEASKTAFTAYLKKVNRRFVKYPVKLEKFLVRD